jgi:hypothetical protein
LIHRLFDLDLVLAFVFRSLVLILVFALNATRRFVLLILVFDLADYGKRFGSRMPVFMRYSNYYLYRVHMIFDLLQQKNPIRDKIDTVNKLLC